MTLTQILALPTDANPRLILASDTRQFYYIAAAAAGSTAVVIDKQRHFDVRDYGAVGDGITDDTTAISDASDAALAAGGGIVFFPKTSSFYKVTSAYQLPIIDSSTPRLTLSWVGEFEPAPSYDLVGGSSTLKSEGVVIKSTTSSILTGPTGTPGTDFSYHHVVLRNIVFRTQDNPTYDAVDLRTVDKVKVEDCVFDTGVISDSMTFPTHGTAGLRLPAANCDQVSARNIVVNGYAIGIDVCEHAVLDNLWMVKCAVALQVNAMNQDGAKIGRMVTVDCPVRVAFVGGNSYVTIDDVDGEYVTTGAWAAGNEIDDPNNYGHGYLRYHSVLAGVGTNTAMVVNGAANLDISPLQKPWVEAVMSGVQSTDVSTWTTVAFGTVSGKSSNGTFSAGRWTPGVHGRISINYSVLLTSVTSGNAGYASLWKNGADFKRLNYITSGSTGLYGLAGTVSDRCTPSDYYELRVACDNDSPIGTNANQTYFSGSTS